MSVRFETERPADYLTRLAASDVGRATKACAVEHLRLGPGHVVLDVGCGPGADLTAFADGVGPDGLVIGVDHDPLALAAALERVAGRPQVRVRSGDAEALPVVDASVDRVHTERVLQHVRDPAAALVEAARVLRPGGRAVFAEPDWDTLVIDHEQPRLACLYRGFVVDHVVRHARVGRRVARLARDAGLVVEQVAPVTSVFLDATAADAVLGLGRVTARAVDAGVMTPPDADRWLAGLTGPSFFAAVTMFVTVAESPTPVEDANPVAGRDIVGP